MGIYAFGSFSTPGAGMNASGFEPWPPWSPSASALAAALAIDLAYGELPARWHPVVWMGRLVRAVERRLPRSGPRVELAGGLLLALGVPLACAAIALAAATLLRPLPLLGWMLHVLVLTALFALRALGDAARAVRRALDAGELGTAREALRSLCSRDPSQLSSEDLVGASVESVAENASDSIVAPLFYYVCFGLLGAVVYRAVNTLDAMVGYRGRYEYLGKASARLDDALNLLPARLTAALLLIAGALLSRDVAHGAAMWRRDGAATESPNAGRPMATMAGLLRVQLEKAGHYRLGDPHEALKPQHIGMAWQIVQLAGLVGAGLAVSALVVVALSG
jgi:adenosylcobinamide-phosphate synthase